MRKILYLAAAAALASLAACNKDGANAETVKAEEISFVSVTSPTKGYISAATFYDTAIAELHNAKPATTARDMQISAWLTPQNGVAGNYFVDYKYSKGDGTKETRWHHNPPIYWPVGGSLDFLAYSVQTPFDSKDVNWADNASESVVLNVLEDKLQDDIVFCAAQQSSTDGATAVAMEFQHAQAWIEFQLKMADAKMKDQLAVESIEIEKLYTTGELTISRSAATASAKWNFRYEMARDFSMPDNYGLYGSQQTEAPFSLTNALDDKVRYMDVLIPEQDKTAFVINYVLAGQPNKLSYRFTLDNAKKGWLMGEKYVYEIVFTTNEITVAPTVREFVAGDVTDLNGSLI